MQLKRISSFFLSFATLVSIVIFFTFCSEEDNTKTTLGQFNDVTGKPGETIKLTGTIEDKNGLESIKLYLSHSGFVIDEIINIPGNPLAYDLEHDVAVPPTAISGTYNVTIQVTNSLNVKTNFGLNIIVSP